MHGRVRSRTRRSAGLGRRITGAGSDGGGARARARRHGRHAERGREGLRASGPARAHLQAGRGLGHGGAGREANVGGGRHCTDGFGVVVEAVAEKVGLVGRHVLAHGVHGQRQVPRCLVAAVHAAVAPHASRDEHRGRQRWRRRRWPHRMPVALSATSAGSSTVPSMPSSSCVNSSPCAASHQSCARYRHKPHVRTGSAASPPACTRAASPSIASVAAAGRCVPHRAVESPVV